MSKESLPPAGQLLRQMPRLLNRRAARNVVATFAFRLSGAEGGSYTLAIDRGECTFREGVPDNPTVLIEAPAQLWLDIAGGRTSPWRAGRSGLAVRGNRLLMLRFNSLFSGDKEGTAVPPGLYGETTNEADHRQGVWRRPQRVLGIQASPRGRGGATEKIYAPFASGLSAAGATVDTVYLAESKIHHCRGCYACWKKLDGHCAIKDDMAQLLTSIPTYDLLVLAVPLYVDSVPGILKDFFDRLIPLNHPYIFNKQGRCRHPSRHQRLPNLVLLSGCGFYEETNFAPLLTQVEAASRNMHMPLLATLLRPHCMTMATETPLPGVEQVTAALAAAGEELIRTGRVARKLRDAIARPLVKRSHYLAAVKKWWLEDEG